MLLGTRILPAHAGGDPVMRPHILVTRDKVGDLRSVEEVRNASRLGPSAELWETIVSQVRKDAGTNSPPNTPWIAAIAAAAVVLDEAQTQAEEDIVLRWHTISPCEPAADGAFTVEQTEQGWAIDTANGRNVVSLSDGLLRVANATTGDAWAVPVSESRRKEP
jgi:hypothetical protein